MKSSSESRLVYEHFEDSRALREAQERLSADGGEVGAEDLEAEAELMNAAVELGEGLEAPIEADGLDAEPDIVPRGARIADGADTPLALLREIVGWLDLEGFLVIDDATTDPTDHMAWRIRSCLARYDGPA